MRFFLTTLILFCFDFAYSQPRTLLQADRAFDRFHFQDAKALYKKVIEQDSNHLHTLKRLGDSYRLTNQLVESKKWYSRVVRFSGIDAKYYLYYAEALRAAYDYENAGKFYLKYLMDYPLDHRARALYGGVQEMQKLLSDSANYTIVNMDFNTDAAEFGSAFFANDGIVFASSRPHQMPLRRADGWFDRPFLDLYVVYKIDDDIFSNPLPFDGEVNMQYHEGPAAFNADFSEMYFTRNFYHKRSRKYDREGVLKLEIFHAEKDQNGWQVTGPVSFSSQEYSNAHPTLTADGNTMYFSSDRPGSIGTGDIYVVQRDENGEWGEPENLGPEINTEGEEAFPFIHPDGTLYFASNGHIGLGGFDIFKAKKQSDGSWDVKNLGPPINSAYDDFAFITDMQKNSGFFSSNRPGGKGSDDIYRFSRLLEHHLKILVLDSLEKTPMEGIAVIIRHAGNGDAFVLFTDAEGQVKFKLEDDPRYHVQVETDNQVLRRSYTFETAELDTSTTFRKKVYILKEEEPEVAPERFVTGDVIQLVNLYYDFDKYHIRPDAAEVLDDLLLILEQYPQLEIKLLSHTDSRGSDAYNLRLSSRRAQSAMNYLISAGISPDRLSFEGFGHRQPVNHCRPGVVCDEEEHQLNRRTEIEIIRGLEN